MITGELCLTIYLGLGLAITSYSIHTEGGLPGFDEDDPADWLALMFMFGVGAVTWPGMLWWYKFDGGAE